MNLITTIPYIAILLANIFYLYMLNFDEGTSWFQVFLFNFAIMALAGTFITIHVNILLHKYLFEGGQEDAKGGKLTKKQLIQKKTKQFIRLKNFAEDLFLPGNESFLLKVYLGMAFFRWVQSFIPGILVGLLFGLLYQYTMPIYDNYIKFYSTKLLLKLMEVMPRHQNTKVIKLPQPTMKLVAKEE